MALDVQELGVKSHSIVKSLFQVSLSSGPQASFLVRADFRDVGTSRAPSKIPTRVLVMVNPRHLAQGLW
jgi:hypothetical protein